MRQNKGLVTTNMPCALCDGSEFQLLAERDRRGRPLPTVICRGCGLVRHAYVPSEQELESFYADRYRQEYHGEYLPSDRRVYRAWKNGQRLVELLIPFLNHGHTVFEVGAGLGCTVKAFETAGYCASGIEPHQGFSSYARQVVHADVRCASLWHYECRQRYDLLLLVHVIEHLRQPVDALTMLRRWVQPHGLLYIECPNLAAPFAAPGKWFHFAHVYNFTPDTLHGVAARSGWKLKMWLSQPDDPVLAGLWSPGTALLGNYAENFQRVIQRLERQTWWQYHLRYEYLRRRVRKLAQYLGEHFVASHRLRRLKQIWAQGPREQLRYAS